MVATPFHFPIGFKLNNQHEEPVLFISNDVAGQTMSLEISNLSDKATLPKSLEEEISALRQQTDKKQRWTYN